MSMNWVKLWVPDELPHKMTLEQQGFWDRLLTVAGDHADRLTPGLIGVSDRMGYTTGQLSELLSVIPSITERFLPWLIKENMITVTENGPITIVNWKHFQGEYLRKRDYREKLKGQMSRLNVHENVPDKKQKQKQKQKQNKNNVSPSNGAIHITDEQRTAFTAAFPRVDVDGERKKAEAWLLANPDKPKKRPVAFFRNWLNNARPTPKTDPTRNPTGVVL